VRSGRNFRLKWAFAAVAALATAGGIAAFNDNADGVWQDMLHHDGVAFSQNYPNGPQRPPGQHTLAVQIGSSDDSASALLLEPGSDPKSVLTDHVGAAAAIMTETANRMSGKNIDVVAINQSDAAEMDAKDPHAQALFSRADVLTLSMGSRNDGDQSLSCSDGNIRTPDDARKADELWRHSHTVMVQSAGNEGGDKRNELQRAAADLTLRGDTYLSIGEAAKQKGNIYIVDYSSRAGPSVVTTNPFRDDFKYRYYDRESPEALRQRLEAFYNSRDPKSGRLNKEIFAQRLALPVYGDDDGAYKVEKGQKQTSACRIPDENKRPDFRLFHPAFFAASFPGREALIMPPAWQAAHADEVREALISELVDAQKFYLAGLFGDMDKQGFVRGLIGTSFAAPHVGGMIAAMREKYPLLSEYDLDAAALLAAVPVDRISTGEVDGEGENIYRIIRYHNNGRGLPHNDYEAGFGFLDEDAYEAMVARMDALRERNPGLATREARAGSPMTSFAKNSGAEYRLQVDGDITALRANLMLKFAGGNAGVPVAITLVNPAGGAIEISSSKPRSGDVRYSFASTDGHFGNHTKGTWIIRVPPGVRLEKAQLSLPGVQKGGLIDRMLDEVTARSMKAASVPTLAPRPG
jgi:hypothetical protein